MKKKIVIFTCTGGHITAAQALQEYLSDEYEVLVLNIFADVLASIDFISFITFKRRNSEDFYNWFLKNHWYGFINKWLLRGYSYYTWQKKRVARHIDSCISRHSPDMVISVVPLFNNHILSSAQKLNIPFLLIPTDIDINTFLNGLDDPKYKKFRIGLMVDNVISRSMLSKAKIDSSVVDIVGPVLRADFFQPKDIGSIRRSFGILPAKRIALLTMGSQGSISLPMFCRRIAQVTTPLHLIVVLGKNKGLRSQLEAIQFPGTISITILDFTSRMADLMAIADLLITKSGGLSVMEGIGMHLPMLLDATSEVIVWEQSNQAMVVQFGLGKVVNKVEDLKYSIETTLQNDEMDKYHDRFAQLLLRMAPDEIRRIVKRMTSE